MNETDQAINVPFVDHQQLDYGGKQNQSELADELIQREFGDIDKLVVSKDKVEIEGKTLVDLDESADEGALGQTNTQPLNETDNSPSSFILRRTDNGEGLRIAVQTSLDVTQRPALRQLIHDLQKTPANDYEIDLNFCPDMSITGIGILLLIRKNIGEDQKNITVKNCNHFILQLLHWAGMDRCFQLQGK